MRWEASGRTAAVLCVMLPRYFRKREREREREIGSYKYST